MTISSGSVTNWFQGVDNLTQDWLCPYALSSAAIGINIGDLCYDAGSGVAYPAGSLTTAGTEAADQVAFAKDFIGCAIDGVLSTETNALRKVVMRTEGVKLFTCPSQTFNVGDLVGIYSDGATIDPTKVDAAQDPDGVIGVVIKRYASATTSVLVYFAARKGGQNIAFQMMRGLGGGGDDVINTNITTVGAGTLTAAAIVGGLITRSGSTAAYTDTTATAAQIVAAIPGATIGQSFLVEIKNTVGFNQTLAAGSGVTLSGQTIIPPNSVGRFLVTLTSLTAVSIRGISIAGMTAPPLLVNTADTTVGAATLTAAAIVGGLITRSGSTAAYTDTTETATNIIAALPNANVGQSWILEIKNTVAFPETLAGGTGVTVSGITKVPPLSVGRFLLTYTAAATVTMVGIGSEPLCNMPPTKFTTSAAASPLTASAGDLTGANHVYFQNTTNGAFALTTRTAAEMFGDIPNAQVGMTFLLTVVSQGDNTVTITGGTNVTITGTATVATKVTRTFVCTFTSATALTMQGVSKGTIE